MNFKKIELKDKDLFYKYIYPYNFMNCEYSFVTLLIWKDACDIEYTVYKDALIIKKRDFQGKYSFMQPLGYSEENFKEIVDKLIEYKKENGMDYLFKDVDEKFIEKIKNIYKNHECLCVKEDRDNFDYLYESEKLIKLSGKNFHNKKNHYNSFINEYDYEVKNINEGKVSFDVIEAAEKWYEENKNKDKSLLYYELSGIKEIVRNFNYLNLQGIAVYVDDIIAGFTIGEKLNDNLAVIHIEKGDVNYRGIYSFINKTFVDRCFKDVKIINREQDLGLEGLRNAKMSYQPLKLEKKFIFNYKC